MKEVGHGIIDYDEGDKVLFTQACYDRAFSNAKSSANPMPVNWAYWERLKAYIGKVGVVKIRFRPGYEFVVEFEDKTEGRHQFKDSWVEPVNENQVQA